MNIIYLCPWGINDPLTISTVFPNINLLLKNEKIEFIHLFTIERKQFRSGYNYNFKYSNRFKHHPISEKKEGGNISKIITIYNLYKSMRRFIKIDNQTLVIARSSISGIVAYINYFLNNQEFIVESYEPHSKYMAEAKEWNKLGIKYLFLSFVERRINKHAYKLLTISNNFKNKLILKGVDKSKLEVVPCPVIFEKYKYDLKVRRIIRKKLNVTEDTIVGIYVGKFGGIYYKNTAFKIFLSSLKIFKKWHLIVLTSMPEDSVINYAVKNGLNANNITVKFVNYNEVSSYLSSADIAFATYRTTKTSLALSPIKIGEYFASGLPVIISENIGDDSKIIQNENAGVIYNFNKQVIDGIRLRNILKEKNHRIRISKLAKKYRSIEITRRVYNEIINSLSVT